MSEMPAVNLQQIEQTVLETVIELHPDHLTISELILRIADDRDPLEREDVRFAIRDLRASGLLRYRGDDQVVEPTHAAIRAAGLLLSI